ncbi:MAG: potassium-transporting ATPase subunit KdpC [Candidatus Gastranaerophilaceae bacterium]
MKNTLIAIKSFIIFSILLGLIYPLAITGIAQVAFTQQANGSLIVENGKIVGSSLIAQKFDKPEYFNSRPSAVDYNASGSGASNFGPTNKKFIEQVKTRREKSGQKTHLPPDMVLTSASGLDPHISLENAKLQTKRVAKIRGISEEKTNELISQNTDSNFLGIWGGVNDLTSTKESSLHGSVNVLKLNIALDKENK